MPDKNQLFHGKTTEKSWNHVIFFFFGWRLVNNIILMTIQRHKQQNGIYVIVYESICRYVYEFIIFSWLCIKVVSIWRTCYIFTPQLVETPKYDGVDLLWKYICNTEKIINKLTYIHIIYKQTKINNQAVVAWISFL